MTRLPVAHAECNYDARINAYTHTHTHTLFCSLQSDGNNRSGIDLRLCENQTRKQEVLCYSSINELYMCIAWLQLVTDSDDFPVPNVSGCWRREFFVLCREH